MKFIKLKRIDAVLLSILIVFHLIGIITFFSAKWRAIVLPLSSLSLLLTFFVMVLSYREQLKKFMLFVIICFVFGITVEYIGVKTSFLFGDYFYGKNLGYKVFDIPLIIGINWGILLIVSGETAHIFSTNVFIRTVFASFLMTTLDFLIEPVALASNYWVWKGNAIPLSNYFCWFLLSLPLNYLFVKFKFTKENKFAPCLYLIFVVFFGVLNFY